MSTAPQVLGVTTQTSATSKGHCSTVCNLSTQAGTTCSQPSTLDYHYHILCPPALQWHPNGQYQIYPASLELKEASVQMPFDGFSQHDYAQKMLDEYTAAGIDPARVYPQSFHLEDITYWLANAPEFAAQAVFLDDRYDDAGFDPQSETSWVPSMTDLKGQGVEIIAPPLWVLVTLDNEGALIPSDYANAANEAGLKIIAWSLERSGLLIDGGGWYYKSITDAIDNEGDVFELLDVLAKDIGVMGVFSDWPSTVTYYANCTGR